MKVISYSWDEIDLNSLAKFNFEAKQARREIYTTQNTLSQERGSLNLRVHIPESRILFCLDDSTETLLGWIAYDLESPNCLEIGRGLPIVRLCDREKEVVKVLLEKCKEACRENSRSKVLINFSIKNRSDNNLYNAHKNWYESQGIVFEDKIAYMTLDLIKYKISSFELNSKYHIKPIKSININDVYTCYLDSFSTSNDRSFLNQSNSERKSHFRTYYDLNKPLVESASIVLIDSSSNRIIGGTIVRPRNDEAHISLLMVHPKFLGKGFGRLLLNLAIKRIHALNYRKISLGVDIQNSNALELYSRTGFNLNSYIVSHSWINEGK